MTLAVGFAVFDAGENLRLCLFAEAIELRDAAIQARLREAGDGIYAELAVERFDFFRAETGISSISSNPGGTEAQSSS